MSSFFYEKWGEAVHISRQGNFDFPLHMHQQIELLCVEQGCVGVQFGKTEYVLRAGETAVIFPNQIHGYVVHKEGCGMSYLTIFPSDILNVLGSAFALLVPETPVVSPTPPAVLTYFETLNSTSKEKGPFCEQKMKALTLLIMAELLPHLTFAVGPTTGAERIGDILSYCSQHYKEPISMARLCEDLHVSTTYAAHVFREYLGASFLTYLTSLRIAEAKRLLQEERYSVTDVALETGFQTIRTFNRAFLAATGQTPSEFRKMSNL